MSENKHTTEQMKALADQCICHPVSRSIDDIEKAGEIIISLLKQRDDLLAALKNAVTVAKSAYECWDNDNDIKVGKYLIALFGGLPGYDKRTDDIHAAIAAAQSNGQPEKPAETEKPAIVFYPAGSLGEEVEEEGRPG